MDSQDTTEAHISAHSGATNGAADSALAATAAEMGLSRGHVPRVTTIAEDALSWGDANGAPSVTLIVPTIAGATGLELAAGARDVLGPEQQVVLWKLLISVGAKGERNELITLPGGGVDGRIARIVAVGLGSADSFAAEHIRVAAGNVSRSLAKSTSEETGGQVISALGLLDAEAAVLGHALGGYTYWGAKAAPKQLLDAISVVIGAAATHDDARAQIITDAVCLARDLVNAPANVLYPETYANLMRAVAEDAGLDVEVLTETELAEQGFGGILGVGQGSTRSPRLVRLSYTPDPAAPRVPNPAGSSSDAPQPRVALVGKGITFDTGGISLKPAAGMWDMIMDMGGSAAVFASIVALARLEVPVPVTATIPLAENMPDGSSLRPGDIIRHYGGTTSEVLNTDAEGRLVLADAIVRACEDEPDYLIETATLTGAQMVALGERTPGIMGSMSFRDKVATISQGVGDNGWAMPLPKELGEALKSDVADLRNISTSRWGGMSVAGHYLAHFVPDGVEWVHIDIAGPAYNTSAPHGYTPKRATGVPVRTIISTVEALAGVQAG